jgi:hypothetical protein
MIKLTSSYKVHLDSNTFTLQLRMGYILSSRKPKFVTLNPYDSMGVVNWQHCNLLILPNSHVIVVKKKGLSWKHEKHCFQHHSLTMCETSQCSAHACPFLSLDLDYFMWWCIANLLCSSIGITLYSPPMLEPWMQNVFHCAQFTMHIVITCGVNCQCFNGKSSWLNHDSHIVQACCPKGVLLCGTLGEATTIFSEWHA